MLIYIKITFIRRLWQAVWLTLNNMGTKKKNTNVFRIRIIITHNIFYVIAQITHTQCKQSDKY